MLRKEEEDKKKRGYKMCSSSYAATDTSWKKDAANSSALTVTQKEAKGLLSLSLSLSLQARALARIGREGTF
jgi:hypothetical protein